jgi:hypothetical protein
MVARRNKSENKKLPRRLTREASHERWQDNWKVVDSSLSFVYFLLSGFEREIKQAASNPSYITLNQSYQSFHQSISI